MVGVVVCQPCAGLRLLNALDSLTLVREDHVTRNYVHFFLFKVLMLSGAAEEAHAAFAVT